MSRKFLPMVLFLVLFGGIGFSQSGAVQIESLGSDTVTESFHSDYVNLEAPDGVEVNVTPKQLFVPDELSDATYYADYSLQEYDGSWPNVSAQINMGIQYGTHYDISYPNDVLATVLGGKDTGLSVNASDRSGDVVLEPHTYNKYVTTTAESGENAAFDVSLEDGPTKWDISLDNVNEHVVVEYDLIQDGSVVWSTEDVYSGEEPDVFPILPADTSTYQVNSLGGYGQELSLTADNRYDESHDVTVVVAWPDKYGFQGFDSGNLSSEQVSNAGEWYDEAEARILSNGLNESVLVDDRTEYDFRAFNVTLPEDSTPEFSSKFLTGSQQNVEGLKMYVVGSVAAVESNSYTGDPIPTPDTWETGNYNPYGIAGGGGTASVQTGTVRHGTYALEAPNGNPDELYYNREYSIRPENITFNMQNGASTRIYTEFYEDTETRAPMFNIRVDTYWKQYCNGNNEFDGDDSQGSWQTYTFENINYSENTIGAVKWNGNTQYTDIAFCNPGNRINGHNYWWNYAGTNYFDAPVMDLPYNDPEIKLNGPSDGAIFSFSDDVQYNFSAYRRAPIINATVYSNADGEWQPEGGVDDDNHYWRDNAIVSRSSTSTGEITWGVKVVTPGQTYWSQNRTYSITPSPEPVLESPADGAPVNNPASFDFTPSCYSTEGCNSGSLYLNYTGNKTYYANVSSSSEWSEGSSSNVIPSDNLVLGLQNPASNIFSSNLGQDGNGQIINHQFGSNNLLNEYFYTTPTVETVEFQEAGTYIVSYSAAWHSETAGRRHIMKNYLVKESGVTSSIVPPSESRCYIRNDGVGDSCTNSGTTLVEASAGDVLYLKGTKDHGDSGNTVTIDDVQLNVREANNPVALVYDSTGGQDYDSGTITVNMDTAVKTDSPFSFDSGNDAISISESGWYKASYTTNLHSTGQGDRQAPYGRIRKSDGTEYGNDLDAYTYIRNANDGDQNHISSTGLINASAGDDVQLRVSKAAKQSSGSSVVMQNKNWILLEKLPDSNVLQLRDVGGGQRIDNGAQNAISFDTTDVEGSIFSAFGPIFSGTSDTLSVDRSGVYTLSYTLVFDDELNNNRHRPKAWFEVNGEKLSGSESRDYTRGCCTAGNYNTMTSTLTTSLSAGDEVQLIGRAEGGYLKVAPDGAYISVIPSRFKSSGSYNSKTFTTDTPVYWKDSVVEASAPSGTSYDIDYGYGNKVLENVTKSNVTDTAAEWSAGVFDETRTNGSLILNQTRTDLFEGFESGNLNNWTLNNNNMNIDGNGRTGTYSAGSWGEGTIDSELKLCDGGCKLDSLELYWYESTDQTGHSFPVVDGNGDVVHVSGNNNPQWEIQDGDGSQRVYDGGGDYNDWIRYSFTYDWPNCEYTYNFENTATGVSREGTRSMDSCDGIESLRVNNNYWGSADWLLIDDIQINGVFGDYKSSGVYNSTIFDANKEVYWKSSHIAAQLPSGTNYDISYGENSSGTWNYYDNFPTNVESRFFKYNISLTGDSTATPSVNSVNLTYDSEEKIPSDFTFYDEPQVDLFADSYKFNVSLTSDGLATPSIGSVGMPYDNVEEVWRGVKTNGSISNNTLSSIEYDFFNLPDHPDNELPSTFNWNVLVEQSDGQTAFDTQNRTVTVEEGGADDTTAPSITVHSPQEFEGYDGTVPLEVSADESASWNYSLNGGVNQSFTPNITLTDADGLSDGLNDLTVYATDGSGNTGSQEVTFTVDDTAPSLSYTSPPTVSDGDVIGRDYATVEVEASDQNLDSVVEQFNGVNSSFVSNPSSSVFYTNHTGLSDGTYSFRAYANDAYGNSASLPLRSFEVDTTPPDITIDSPVEGEAYDSDTVSLDVSANEGIDTWVRELDGVNETFTPNVSLSGLSEGSHDLTVYAIDSAGNTGEASVSFSVDTTVPDFTWVEPQNNRFYDATVPVEVVPSEPANWDYRIDGGAYQSFTPNTTLSYPEDIPNEGSITGIEVRALDDAGNEVLQGPRSIVVDDSPPFVGYNEESLRGEKGDSDWDSDEENPVDDGEVINESKAYVEWEIVDNSSQYNSGIDGATERLVLDGVSQEFGIGYNELAYDNITGLSEGQHTVSAYAQDQVGNNGSSQDISFTVDLTDPVVSIDDSEVGGSINFSDPTPNLSVSASDNLASTVNLSVELVDSGELLYSSIDSTGSRVVELSALSPGYYDVRATAKDDGGNVGESSVKTLKVEEGFDVVSPENKTYESGSLDLNIVEDDPNNYYDLGNYRYSLNGGVNQSFTPNTSLSLNENDYVLEVFADDVEGKVHEGTKEFSVGNPPYSKNFTTNGTPVVDDGDIIYLSSYFNDDLSGVSEIRLASDAGGSWENLTGKSVSFSPVGGEWRQGNFTFNTSGLGGGPAQFRMWGVDDTGKWSSTSVKTVELWQNVSTWEELDSVRNDLNGYYRLMNNLGPNDAGFETYAGGGANGGNGWNPIGEVGYTPISREFSGVFEGGNYTIKGLRISRGSISDNHIGLFASVNGASIRNIGLSNLSVNGVDKVGGVAGRLRNSEVRYAWVSGDIQGSTDVGGVVGQAEDSNIDTVFSNGSVTGSEIHVGGLIGYAYNFGVSLSDSFSRMNVYGQDADRIGGVMGETWTDGVVDVYSTGVVDSGGGSNVGGLVGYNYQDYSFEDAYWDMNTSNQSTSAAGTGLETFEMTYPNSESNLVFDFDSKWFSYPGVNDGYPVQRRFCQIGVFCSPQFEDASVEPNPVKVGSSGDVSYFVRDPDTQIGSVKLSLFKEGVLEKEESFQYSEGSLSKAVEDFESGRIQGWQGNLSAFNVNESYSNVISGLRSGRLVDDANGTTEVSAVATEDSLDEVGFKYRFNEQGDQSSARIEFINSAGNVAGNLYTVGSQDGNDCGPFCSPSPAYTRINGVDAGFGLEYVIPQDGSVVPLSFKFDFASDSMRVFSGDDYVGNVSLVNPSTTIEKVNITVDRNYASSQDIVVDDVRYLSGSSISGENRWLSSLSDVQEDWFNPTEKANYTLKLNATDSNGGSTTEIVDLAKYYGESTTLQATLSSVLESNIGYNRSSIEPVSVSNLAESTNTFLDEASDSISVVGNVVDSFTYVNNVTNDLSVVDGVGSQKKLKVDSAVTASVQSSVNTVFDLSRDVFGQVSISGSVESVFSSVNTPNNQFNIGSSVEGLLNLSMYAEEDVALSTDGASAVFDVARSLTNKVNVAGSQFSAGSINRTASNTVMVDDVVGRESAFNRTGSNSINTVDDVGIVANFIRTSAEEVSVISDTSTLVDFTRKVVSPIDIGSGVVENLFYTDDASANIGLLNSIDSIQADFYPSVVQEISVASQMGRGVSYTRGLVGSVFVQDEVERTGDYNTFISENFGIDELLFGNTKPSIEGVEIQARGLGKDRNVKLVVDVRDGDGLSDRNEVSFGYTSKKISSTDRNVTLDINDNKDVTGVVSVVDDSGAKDTYNISYSITDNGYEQDGSYENNLSTQKVSVNDVFENTGTNVLSANISHDDYEASQVVNPYVVDTVQPGESINLETTLVGDFLVESKQWRTDPDDYQTVRNQSIINELNVSNEFDYLTWTGIHTGKVNVPDGFGGCSSCGDKLIDVSPEGYSNYRQWATTGDGIQDEYVQDITDVVIGERDEYWEQYSYENITGEVEFRNINANVTLDDTLYQYQEFIRVNAQNTWNNSLLPDGSNSCNTESPDLQELEIGNSTWKACTQDIDGENGSEYFKIQIPDFSKHQVRFGGFNVPLEEAEFYYRLGYPCPDKLQGNMVGPNSSYTCYNNLVMEPEQAELQKKDVSFDIGQGLSGVLYFLIFLLLLFVVFYRDELGKEVDDSFDEYGFNAQR